LFSLLAEHFDNCSVDIFNMCFILYHLVLCIIILLCLFNPAFHAAVLNKP